MVISAIMAGIAAVAFLVYDKSLIGFALSIGSLISSVVTGAILNGLRLIAGNLKAIRQHLDEREIR